VLTIITGATGIGKTTVCAKAIDSLTTHGLTCGGVLCWKEAGGGIQLEDVESGDTVHLAGVSDEYSGPRAGKYCFNPEAIDIGNGIIERAAKRDVVVVDELGLLELAGHGFTSAVDLISTGRFNNAIVVIRSELLPEYLPILGVSPLVFTTTRKNRERLAADIVSNIAARLTAA